MESQKKFLFALLIGNNPTSQIITSDLAYFF